MITLKYILVSQNIGVEFERDQSMPDVQITM